MSKNLPIVAIIGQTNAGKSALFNRIVGGQEAIVAREEGTTRDSVVRTVYSDSHSELVSESKQSHRFRNRSGMTATNTPFVLVDTAGMKAPEDDFEATIQEQIADAVDSADLILLVKDRTEYVTDEDRRIAKTALKSKKPVFLVLNKTDLKEKLPKDEFLRLGIKADDMIETSAEHNMGTRYLVERIVKSFSDISTPLRVNGADRATGSPEVSDSSEIEMGKSPGSDRLTRKGMSEKDLDDSSSQIKIALIGRPNVGKSNLFNALAGKQQAIVAPIAGTTRDVNRISVKYHGGEIELLDTAGVRRSGKIEQGVEKFSILRTVSAIEESDICLLLMDVNELNTSVDLSLAGMITEAGKGIIIVVTKWDDATDELRVTSHESRIAAADRASHLAPRDSDEILADMREKFKFIPYAPVIFTSSVTGKNLPKIFELATEINQRRQQQIPTRKLNDVLASAVLKHPPAGLKNTLPKMRYIVQTDIAPPWFVIYGANFKHIHWSYKRYLERNLRENFDLVGTPIRFSFRDEKQIKANREATK